MNLANKILVIITAIVLCISFAYILDTYTASVSTIKFVVKDKNTFNENGYVTVEVEGDLKQVLVSEYYIATAKTGDSLCITYRNKRVFKDQFFITIE